MLINYSTRTGKRHPRIINERWYEYRLRYDVDKKVWVITAGCQTWRSFAAARKHYSSPEQYARDHGTDNLDVFFSPPAERCRHGNECLDRLEAFAKKNRIYVGPKKKRKVVRKKK